jgi:hypothetical protein
MASTAPIHFTGVRRRGRYPKTAVFAAGVALDHHASTSSTSVGSSSPLPLLLTRQDTSTAILKFESYQAALSSL